MNSATRIYFAPFQSITGKVFRAVFSKYFGGIDKLYTPYFTGIQHGTKLSPAKTLELQNTAENRVEVVPQILSKEADEIIRFAGIIEKLGFTELNWNLGCPFPQVADKKRGSGLLPYPEMIDEILRQVLPEINIRFSVKCRLGYESTQEFQKLIPVFNSYNISELTLHPRIGRQLYKGNADANAFANCTQELKMPVVYNGDITSLLRFQQISAELPTTNTWMIGRSLLADPFLAMRIKGLSLPTDENVHVRKFVNELYLGYRKHMKDHLAAIGFMKEYWHYLAQSFNDPHKVFKKLRKTNSFEDYETAVDEIFEHYFWK